jgi:threonine dehydrogenase-like Zn-dependent dehydrogenase
MRAATLIAPGTFEIQHVLVPKPGPDEMLVRIEGCGVCASNIPPFEGRDWFKYPMTPGQLGHEAWGVVEEAGEAINQFRVGDRVAILTNHAYAEYDLARERQTVRLPAALDGKPFPAEPLGCAINIFRRSRITKGQTVAIVGIGFLGALLTRLASDIGANVIAISRRPFSLDMARDMGARELLEMDDHWKIIERVKEITFGRFCDVVVEAVGKQWPLDLAGELTGERGRLVVAGYHQDGLRQVNMQLWNWRGFDVINAHERDPNIYLAGMQAAVELVSSGRLDPRSLYTHRFSLENLGKAMEMTAQRPDGFFKALVTM